MVEIKRVELLTQACRASVIPFHYIPIGSGDKIWTCTMSSFQARRPTRLVHSAILKTIGSGERNWTPNLLSTDQLLCQLSYTGMVHPSWLEQLLARLSSVCATITPRMDGRAWKIWTFNKGFKDLCVTITLTLHGTDTRIWTLTNCFGDNYATVTSCPYGGPKGNRIPTSP